MSDHLDTAAAAPAVTTDIGAPTGTGPQSRKRPASPVVCLTYIESEGCFGPDGVCLIALHFFRTVAGNHYAYAEHLDGQVHWHCHTEVAGKVSLTYVVPTDDPAPWQAAIDSIPAKFRLATSWATFATMGGKA